jgi:RimJ/RimL family protein N-acetyltransferase
VIDLAAPTTARLRGEPIGPQHRAGLIALLGDPRVGETLGGTASPEQVDEQIARMSAGFAREGFGLYAWLDRDTGELVARGGVQRTTFDGADEVELAWAVVAHRWGEGLATELGAACVELAFGPLALPDVVAFTLPHNRGSRRVMEKLGMTYEKTAEYKVYGPHVLYRLRADRRLPPADP